MKGANFGIYEGVVVHMHIRKGRNKMKREGRNKMKRDNKCKVQKCTKTSDCDMYFSTHVGKEKSGS